MDLSSDPISEPIPISLIAGRYLLFDVNVVTYLRSTHHICGSMIGTIPQNPQQNVFLGLPVELMPEEANLLVQKEVAYIVDDRSWHKSFHTSDGVDRQKYLESLRATGIKARKAAQHNARKSSEKALAKIARQKAAAEAEAGIEEDSSLLTETDAPYTSLDESSTIADDSTEASLFGGEGSRAPSTSAFHSTAPYAVTPTTTYSPSSLPQNPDPPSDPDVRSSYALFAHLHSLDYFIMPGLRFGCDFNVYPGDPLRFHSHFLATSYGFNQDIPMLDIIGGGRLGTAVKKGFLIGGADTDSEKVDNVRTFCIEWGGM
jgi:tRNA-splicing endonuclease subunit Sen34